MTSGLVVNRIDRASTHPLSQRPVNEAAGRIGRVLAGRLGGRSSTQEKRCRNDELAFRQHRKSPLFCFPKTDNERGLASFQTLPKV
jgi:hypothetical protein